VASKRGRHLSFSRFTTRKEEQIGRYQRALLGDTGDRRGAHPSDTPGRVRRDPSAGKSTIAKLLVAQIPDPVLISSDEIRSELGVEADQSQNLKVFKIAYQRLRPALDDGKTVIWDATNSQAWARQMLVKASRLRGIETLAVHLRVPLTVALQRNAQRSRHLRLGPVEKMYQDLTSVTTAQLRQEGFTRALELAV
jgi:predicted kinase